MKNLKFKLKIKELEIEVSGERDQLPNITNQIGGLLQMPNAMIESQSPSNVPQKNIPDQTPAPKFRRKTSRGAAVNPSEDSGSEIINFSHNPEKWGNPSQEWSTAQKAMWLLFVVQAAANLKELSASQITATFNRHFREAKTILLGNVSRDLAKQKMKSPSPVGEETTKSPSMWYLTDEGKRLSQQLISARLGQSSITTAA